MKRVSETAKPRPAGKRRRQKWLLTAFGIVFATSAVLRIGALELAFAESDGSPRDVLDSAETAMASAPSSNASSSEVTGRLRDALAEVEALREQLQGREAVIADRERAVEAAQVLIEARLSELEAAEARLAELITMSDGAAEADILRLTRVYETMDAAHTAALFEQMEPSFAAGFISRMSPAAGAELMAEMTPETAYAVSVIMATRNASAPRLSSE